MVRVEVLVPASSRQAILDEAAKLRASHRGSRPLSAEQDRLFDDATRRYGARCLWNCKPPRTVEGMRTVAARLKAHGDMAAWRLALDIEESLADAAR